MIEFPLVMLKHLMEMRNGSIMSGHTLMSQKTWLDHDHYAYAYEDGSNKTLKQLG